MAGNVGGEFDDLDDTALAVKNRIVGRLQPDFLPVFTDTYLLPITNLPQGACPGKHDNPVRQKSCDVVLRLPWIDIPWRDRNSCSCSG